jgi:hypothetical protein
MQCSLPAHLASTKLSVPNPTNSQLSPLQIVYHWDQSRFKACSSTVAEVTQSLLLWKLSETWPTSARAGPRAGPRLRFPRQTPRMPTTCYCRPESVCKIHGFYSSMNNMTNHVHNLLQTRKTADRTWNESGHGAGTYDPYLVEIIR